MRDRNTIGAVALLLMALLLPVESRADVTVFGVEELVFRWAPAAGDPIGYVVYTSNHGSAYGAYKFETTTEGTIPVAIGDAIEVVIVGLFLRDGKYLLGPSSEPSVVHHIADVDAVASAGERAVLHDFDGDGQADLLIANSGSGWIRLWRVSGLSVVYNKVIATVPFDQIVSSGDFDGDAINEMLLHDRQTGTLRTYPDTLTSGIGVGWEFAATGDFDGDGRTDIAIHKGDDYELRSLDGTLQSAFFAGEGGNAGAELVATADVDGDGDDDLHFRHASGALLVWFVEGGEPTLSELVTFEDADWSIASTGDLNGDGRADLLWQHWDGRAYASLMSGGSILAEVELQTPNGFWALGDPRDLDGDGDLDLMWRHATGKLAGSLMNGTETERIGAFQQAITSAWSLVGSK